ncbi:DNA-protecting protein DprA [bacterium]|nr:DNA-protecting protein DprA [bacterium]
MTFIEDLTLILARGLPAEAAHLAASGQIAEFGLEDNRRRQAFLNALEARGLLRRGAAVMWPDERRVCSLADRIQREGIRLAWRRAESYPKQLAEWLGAEAPAWAWIAGDEERLGAPVCSFVGSRQTTPPFLAAARKLARALADHRVAIASGMAAGADEAAHDGAQGGRAGTIAIPARGILSLGLSDAICRKLNMTALALGRPEEPFSAGLAIRRNAVIAAMGRGLVLVAGGLRGGSSHAVRWAVSWRRPLWCFEAGRDTPPANQSLIRDGLAEPLPFDENLEQWLGRIVPALSKADRTGKSDVQLDLLNPS